MFVVKKMKADWEGVGVDKKRIGEKKIIAFETALSVAGTIQGNSIYVSAAQ